MQPQDPLEVLFCDLCSTSVPLQEVESGAAVRHRGRTIGSCCLSYLRAEPAHKATTAPSTGVAQSAATAAAAPGAGSAGERRHGEARVLPLGVAMLAAIAAATLYLEYRIDQAEVRNARNFDDIAGSSKSQAEVVQGISMALDGVARRADYDRLQERLVSLEQAHGRSSDQLADLAKTQGRATDSLQTDVRALVEADRRRQDPAPMLGELQAKVQQIAAGIAELAARPRQADRAEPVSAAMPPAVPGLSPELAHLVGMLKDEDPARRFDAVDQLLRSKSQLVLEHLLPMLHDADPFVRRLTVDGVKDFRKPAVVDALLVALADPEEIVRAAAWGSLKDVTGQKLPFEPGGTRDARLRAQQKWQEWWDKNRDTFGA